MRPNEKVWMSREELESIKSGLKAAVRIQEDALRTQRINLGLIVVTLVCIVATLGILMARTFGWVT